MEEIIAVNTVEDLLKGDQWEYVTLSGVLEIISKKDSFGMGTTTRDTNGEVLFYQKDGSTRFFWIDPETFEAKIIVDEEEKFPFIAIFFPGKEKQEFWLKGDVKEEIAKCIEKTGLKDAALFLEGKFSNVKLSAAAHLPKLGIDTEMKFKSFEKTHRADWIAGGVYTENYLNELSYFGQKIHLHVINEEDGLGGHLLSGMCEDVKVKIYPIKKVECLHSDLTVHSGRVVDTTLVFTAENLGFSNTENVKVLVRIDDKEYVKVIALKRRESKEMVFKINGKPRMIEAIIDPDNYILESDETNNRFVMSF